MRLFLALALPDDVRHLLAEAQQQLRQQCSGWRWVRPEGIHLTIRFLGEVSESDDAVQRNTWREAAAGTGPIEFHLGGVGLFPSASRPRVLWVGVHDDTRDGRLLALAEAVEHAARSAGHAAETRPFRPHLTVARAARGRRATARDTSFEIRRVDTRATELTLFQSRLGPGGARYTRLEGFPLAG